MCRTIASLAPYSNDRLFDNVYALGHAYLSFICFDNYNIFSYRSLSPEKINPYPDS